MRSAGVKNSFDGTTIMVKMQEQDEWDDYDFEDEEWDEEETEEEIK